MPLTSPDQLSLLTGARQTMAAWSKLIDSYPATPEAYQAYLRPFAKPGQVFPYAVLTPAIDHFQHKTTEKLVYDFEGALHLLEQVRGQVTQTSFPYASIQILEVGNVLLQSWITLSGLTSTGQPGSATIDFNAASGERHFSHFIQKIRPASRSNDEAGFKTEKNKFDYLAVVNFKMMNYGRSSLVRGEKVLQILFQPEIRPGQWKFSSWTFSPALTPAHLTVLTDQELILILDNPHAKKLSEGKYGGVWQYLPLRSLVNATLEKTKPDELTLTVTTHANETLRKTFSAANPAEVIQLHQKLLERIK